MQYRHLRIDYMEDCGPNEGGYLRIKFNFELINCQVFRASDDKQIDDFCIHSDEITAETDPEDMIRSYIDRMCHAYRREGQLEAPGFSQLTM